MGGRALGNDIPDRHHDRESPRLPTVEQFLVDPVVRTAILVGFLGGFTTFSSFGIQTFTLLRDGEVFLATINIVISNVVGITLVWVGYAFSKSL